MRLNCSLSASGAPFLNLLSVNSAGAIPRDCPGPYFVFAEISMVSPEFAQVHVGDSRQMNTVHKPAYIIYNTVLSILLIDSFNFCHKLC